MRLGIHVQTPPGAANALDALVAEAAGAHRHGLELWLPQTDNVDALTAVAVIGREIPGLRVGTSCVPIWPRHPLALAMQALTAQAATGNRLALGVGLSHRAHIEEPYGIAWTRPADTMREYLEILVPLLRHGEVDFEGELLATRTPQPVRVAGAEPPRVLVAALGPRMLEVAGELADGALVWFVGPRTLAAHVVPRLGAGATAGGRTGRPEVVVHLPVCVTSGPEAARRQVAARYASYGELPSFRAVLDREGADGPADVAVIGDETEVAGQLHALAEAGATTLGLRPVGSSEEQRRTLALLGELAS